MRILMTRRSGRRRRGAAATEFALLLPVLMVLVFGSVDFGRFAYDLIAVTNAARAGASYGMMNNFSTSTRAAWNSSVRTAATAEISGQDGYASANLNIPDPVVTVDSNGLRRVQVTVNYQFTTIVNWPGIPHITTLSRMVEMRLIR